MYFTSLSGDVRCSEVDTTAEGFSRRQELGKKTSPPKPRAVRWCGKKTRSRSSRLVPGSKQNQAGHSVSTEAHKGREAGREATRPSQNHTMVQSQSGRRKGLPRVRLCQRGRPEAEKLPCSQGSCQLSHCSFSAQDWRNLRGLG